MRVNFSTNKVKLYKQDVIVFLKSMPDESLDLITTDPAYSGMNDKLKLGKGRIVGDYQKNIAQKWFEEFKDDPDNFRIFLKECYRVLKKDRHIYIMFDSFSLLTLAPIIREVFDVKNILVWDKVNIGMGHYYRRRHEFIVFASKGKRKLNARNFPDVIQIKRINRAKYPTQKPVALYEYMLQASAEPGFVVCDPFLGSGSAAIAALKNNCSFIGCDISEKALEISSSRVEAFSKSGIDELESNIIKSSKKVEGDDRNESLLGDLVWLK